VIDNGFDSNAPYSGYRYRCVGISKQPEGIILKTIVYTFRTPKRVYKVIVEEYPYQLFVLKFHLNNSSGKTKYHIQTDDQDAPRVIATCCHILLKEIKFKNELASFGFIGSNTILPEKEKKAEDLTPIQKKRLERRNESVENTRRFRIYSLLSKRVFDPENYFHIEDVPNSSYLILNKLNKEPDLVSKVAQMFEEYYLRDEPESFPSVATTG